jgi:hypothetical protein
MSLSDSKVAQYATYPARIGDTLIISGVPGSTWSFGAHFEGQNSLFSSCGHGDCPLWRHGFLSELTLTAIHRVAEPAVMFILLGALVLLGSRRLHM